MNRCGEMENKARKIMGNSEFKEVNEYIVVLELSEPPSLALSVIELLPRPIWWYEALSQNICAHPHQWPYKRFVRR